MDWLNRQGGHRESPTALHVEYVRASRQNATTRLRRLLAAAGAAVAISLALAGIALWQRNEAVRQADLSHSRELAALANDVVPRDPELALLLAREGGRAAETTEVADALRRPCCSRGSCGGCATAASSTAPCSWGARTPSHPRARMGP